MRLLRCRARAGNEPDTLDARLQFRWPQGETVIPVSSG